jgi:hypothetical protein
MLTFGTLGLMVACEAFDPFRPGSEEFNLLRRTASAAESGIYIIYNAGNLVLKQRWLRVEQQRLKVEQKRLKVGQERRDIEQERWDMRYAPDEVICDEYVSSISLCRVAARRPCRLYNWSVKNENGVSTP